MGIFPQIKNFYKIFQNSPKFEKNLFFEKSKIFGVHGKVGTHQREKFGPNPLHGRCKRWAKSRNFPNFGISQKSENLRFSAKILKISRNPWISRDFHKMWAVAHISGKLPKIKDFGQFKGNPLDFPTTLHCTVLQYSAVHHRANLQCKFAPKVDIKIFRFLSKNFPQILSDLQGWRRNGGTFQGKCRVPLHFTVKCPNFPQSQILWKIFLKFFQNPTNFFKIWDRKSVV
jgi:hypothetical protein